MLPAAALQKLEAQIEKNPGATPQAVLKALVERGMLTKFQAQSLLAEVAPPKPTEDEPAPEASAPIEPKPPRAKTDDDELGLAPIDEDAAAEAKKAKSATKTPASRPRGGDAAGPKPPPQPLPAQPKRIEPRGDLSSATASKPADAGLAAELDSLLEDPLAGAAAGGPLGPAQPKKKGLFGLFGGGPAKGKKTSGPRWDSPIILTGGGVVVVLVIIGVTLVIALRGGVNEQAFQTAEQHYRDAAYAQAIGAYQQYADAYPDDPKASQARVRIALARLRQHTERTPGDFEKAVAIAQTELPRVKDEAAFRDYDDETSGILLKIAEHFAEAARSSQDIVQTRELLKRCAQTFALIDHPEYVPSSRRRSIASALDRIALARQEAQWRVDRSEAIDQVVARIEAALTQKPFTRERAGEAYAALASLREYGRITGRPTLAKIRQELSSRMGQLVEVDATVAAAERNDAQAALTTLLLATTESQSGGGPDSAAADTTVAVWVAGRLYGVSLAGGEVRWSRPIGSWPTTPERLELDGESAGRLIYLAADPWRVECVASADGSLNWNQPLAEEAFPLTIHKNRTYTTLRTGEILVFDATTGARILAISLPQPLAASATVEPDTGHLIVAAERDNLYRLSAEGACLAVHYLGHQPGMIQAPPLLAGGTLLIAENDAANCRLHAVSLKDDAMQTAGEPTPLTGRVVSPGAVDAGHAIFVSERGRAHLLRVDPAAENIVKPLASTAAVAEWPIYPFAIADAGFLWVADEQLSGYELQYPLSRITRSVSYLDGAVIEAPPVRVGNHLVVAARRRFPMQTVMDGYQRKNASDFERVWRTTLSPPARAMMAPGSSRSVLVVTADGSIFTRSVTGGGTGQRLWPRDPRDLVDGRAPVIETVLAEDASAVTYFARAANGESLLLQAPGSGEGDVAAVMLRPPDDANISGTPIPLGASVLAGLDNGQMAFFDMATGAVVGEPTQAPKTPLGVKLRWLGPVMATGDETFAALNDQLFKVSLSGAASGIRLAPAANLTMLAAGAPEAAKFGQPQLAAGGERLWLLVPEETTSSLYTAATSAADDWRKLADGDFAHDSFLVPTGTGVLAADVNRRLVLFGPEGRLWGPVDTGPCAGTPLLRDDLVWFVTTAGDCVAVAAANGEVLRQTALSGMPAHGPFSLGAAVAVGMADGSLGWINPARIQASEK